MNCHVCDAATSPFSRGLILHKYDVQYYRCPACGFIQTESPFWLDEAYSSAITNTDIGPINRMMDTTSKTAAVLLSFFDAHGKYVDYGGGYGLFVRRMRDIGFDYRYYDKYCENIFSGGFEVPIESPHEAEYELATAFEVIEHMANECEGMREVTRFSRSIFFSTEIIPADTPKPGEWWYYSPEHGQHISFFTRTSLYRLATRLGLRLYTHGSFHLMTDKRLNPRLYRMVLNEKLTPAIVYILSRYHKINSLLQDDWQRLLKNESTR